VSFSLFRSAASTTAQELSLVGCLTQPVLTEEKQSIIEGFMSGGIAETPTQRFYTVTLTSTLTLELTSTMNTISVSTCTILATTTIISNNLALPTTSSLASTQIYTTTIVSIITSERLVTLAIFSTVIEHETKTCFVPAPTRTRRITSVSVSTCSFTSSVYLEGATTVTYVVTAAGPPAAQEQAQYVAQTTRPARTITRVSITTLRRQGGSTTITRPRTSTLVRISTITSTITSCARLSYPKRWHDGAHRR
jgi:hypothetical protein